MLHRYKKFGLAIIVLSIGITLALFVGAKSDRYPWNAVWLTTIGQVSALIGTVLLSQTFLLSSRLSWLERVIGGFDVVYKLHQLLGKTSFILLLLHPTFLALSYLPSVVGLLYFITPFNDAAKTAGQVSLLALSALILITLYVKMPYHIWKMTHEWMGVVLFFAALHVFLIPSDTASSPLLRVWILGWMASAAAAFLYRRFLYQHIGPKYEYHVTGVRVTGDITQLTLKPISKSLTFSPGQFVFLQVHDPSGAVTKEKHPFSIASGLDEEELVLWCKNLGDYTSDLPKIKTKTAVTLFGPYGAFLDTLPFAKQIVGIAGGIGITPFVSLLKSPLTIHAPVTIIHTCKTKSEMPSVDIPTKDADANQPISYLLHESATAGRLTAETITEKIDNWKTAHYYICGPVPMMESLRDQLLHLGVRSSRIIFEDFSLRP